jgi:hypothetical protein
MRHSFNTKRSRSNNSCSTYQSSIRRTSKANFQRFSADIVRKSSSVTTVLDGKQKRSSYQNTEILKARERVNQYQRVKNDHSINVMLISVSVAFLILTFPYQIVWIVEQLYWIILNNKVRDKMLNDERREEKYFLFQTKFHLVFTSIKDVALTIRNINFSISFFLYSTMSNLFRRELNFLFQHLGLKNFVLFKNSISTTANNNFTLTNTRRTSAFTCKSFLPEKIVNLNWNLYNCFILIVHMIA